MNTPRVVIEKLVLAFSIAIAAAVGLAPAIYYVAPHNYYFGPNRLLFYSAAQGAFVAAFYFFAAESEAPLAQGPSALEYLLRALAAVSFWGFLGVIWLIVYGAVYWLVRLIGLVSVWLKGPSLNATRVAFYASFVFASLFAIGIALAIAQNITNRLYSMKVSSRIASYNDVLRGQSRTWIYSGLSVGSLIAMWLIIQQNPSWGFWGHFFLQLIPYVSCAWLLGLGSRVRKDSDIVNAIGSLLRATGYEVLFSPRSKDPTFQTLVSGLDIIATKEKTALIIQVKTQSSSLAPVDWTAGSSLRMKAKALEQPALLEKLEIPTLTDKEIITPLIVLCGREQDSTLAEFSAKESLPVVLVNMELIEKILVTEDPDELRALAEKYFQNIAACGDETASNPQNSQGLVKEGQWAY